MGEFFTNLFKLTAIVVTAFVLMTVVSGVCIWAGMFSLFATIF